MYKTLYPMKRTIPFISAICCAAILLQACAGSKNSLSDKSTEIVNNKVTNGTCYVEFTDGSTKQFASLKLITGIFKTPHLLADNKQVLNSKEIKSYYDGQYFAVSDKALTTSKTSYVAVDALPGFARRIATGKLNVYSRKFYNGNNSVEEYFLQIGSNSPIVAYSTEVMKGILKDNAKALEYFNSNAKVSPVSKKILTAVEIYNNGELLSKN